MSGIPNEIPDFGSVAGKPRQNGSFSPGADFTTEDYFVWSRCDGATSIREIILMLGMGTERAIEILRKLRGAGAVLLEGETSAPPRRRRPTVSRYEESPSGDERELPGLDVSRAELGALSAEEEAALAEDVALDEAEKCRVIAAMRRVKTANHFELLGVRPGADRRAIKRAYFQLSKAFHPDRHYGQDVGSFGPWFEGVFSAVTRAFQELSDPRRRAEYEAALQGERPRAQTTRGQTREEHAAELFARACQRETAGAAEKALDLFAAAIRVDPQPAYLRRAAMCARSAGKLSTAEEYAKKAADLRPGDPSMARLLADVYRAEGRLVEAEAILLRALDLRTENDALVRELEADLAAVRAALTPAGTARGD